jgi:hypothetical protein
VDVKTPAESIPGPPEFKPDLEPAGPLGLVALAPS